MEKIPKLYNTQFSNQSPFDIFVIGKSISQEYSNNMSTLCKSYNILNLAGVKYIELNILELQGYIMLNISNKNICNSFNIKIVKYEENKIKSTEEYKGSLLISKELDGYNDDVVVISNIYKLEHQK